MPNQRSKSKCCISAYIAVWKKKILWRIADARKITLTQFQEQLFNREIDLFFKKA